MFCPDCGTQNVRGQKYCTHCGTNLIAIDRARDIVTEMASGPAAPAFEPSTILKIVALISIVGFICITIGTLILMGIDDGRTPIPIFFSVGGFLTLIAICRYLLKIISSSTTVKSINSNPLSYAPPPQPVRGATNHRLAEPGYQSIVEDPTKQFERK